MRRNVLKTLAAGGTMLAMPAVLRPAAGAVEPDIFVRLVAAPDNVRIRPGPETRVLRYTAEVLRGRGDAIRPSSGYLGPTLELRRGERVRIEVVNRAGEPTVIHWHGRALHDRIHRAQSGGNVPIPPAPAPHYGKASVLRACGIADRARTRGA